MYLRISPGTALDIIAFFTVPTVKTGSVVVEEYPVPLFESFYSFTFLNDNPGRFVTDDEYTRA
jgi:hypothetical protein